MIAQLRGKISEAGLGYVVLDVGGVGYKVHTGLAEIAKPGEQATLLTHLAVREDAFTLYGFKDREALNFFEMLIKIPGIGPKSGMNILSVSSLSSLKEAIGTGNVGYLTKISGIGRKTAEKIVLELRDKLPVSSSPAYGLQSEADALEALESLGYARKEAHEALRAVASQSKAPSADGAATRVREALKILGKHS